MGAYPADFASSVILLSTGMLMMLLWRCRIILTFGLMVAETISLLLVGLRLLDAGVYLLASEVAFDHSVWGVSD